MGAGLDRSLSAKTTVMAQIVTDSVLYRQREEIEGKKERRKEKNAG